MKRCTRLEVQFAESEKRFVEHTRVTGAEQSRAKRVSDVAAFIIAAAFTAMGYGASLVADPVTRWTGAMLVIFCGIIGLAALALTIFPHGRGGR